MHRLRSVLAIVGVVALAASAVLWAMGFAAHAGQSGVHDDPATPSSDALAWCTGHGWSGGYPPVIDAGQAYFGMVRRNSDSGAVGLDQDPAFGASCSIAFEVYGLSSAEWDWCGDSANRSKLLKPSLAVLGLGRAEAGGTDSFGSAPGDDAAEYTQACRFAYRYARPSGRVPNIAVTHPFLVLSSADAAWCADHVSALDEAARLIPLGRPVGASAAAVADREAYVRACRFAHILDAGRRVVAAFPSAAASAAPIASAVTGSSVQLEMLIQNQTSVDMVVWQATPTVWGGTRVRACGWARINQVDRALPLTLSAGPATARPETYAPFYSLKAEPQVNPVRLLVSLTDERVDVAAVEDVPAAGSGCPSSSWSESPS